MIERLRSTRLDAGLAGAFVLIGLAQAIAVPIAPGVLGEVFVLGSTLPLAWRRTYPVESALAASAFWLIPLDGFPVLGLLVVIVQFFALGNSGAPGRAVALTTVWATAVSVVGTLLGPEEPVAAIGGVLAVVASVLAGAAVRHEQRQKQALADLAAELRAQRAKAEAVAVTEERARIAQELHDVVGHDVTLIAVQAEAAAAALRVAPERATEPVEAIRTTAHRTLAEMRAVLNMINPASEAGHSSEGPVELAERAAAAGIPNSLSVTGTPAPEHSPVSLAVNRIVRECLTNAGRHAPGQRVELRVDWRPDGVCLRSSNPVGSSADLVPGRGLNGIRHRAELLGGSFAAVADAGEFDVRVRIPTGEPS